MHINSYDALYLANQCLHMQMGGASQIKWKTLRHAGVLFPPPYVPHGIPIRVQGESIVLDAASEEIATLYAKLLGTDYVQDAVLNKNFWKGWKRILGNRYPMIKSLSDVDFSLIHAHILQQREQLKLTAQARKEEREAIEAPYKIAYLNGEPQPVGNFRIEPPGLFMGRGCNPKKGRIKPRIQPEDITLNLDRQAPIPLAPEGHRWGKIIHDNTLEWIASWKDIISGKVKYVRLGDQSKFKSDADQKKFDLARKLGKSIRSIRDKNMQLLASSNMKEKQIAIALYFIDQFALRVGNEKGSDEADTVGVTSLRKEHITLLDNHQIRLNFLGKDSVRYDRKLALHPLIYETLQSLLAHKQAEEQLLDQIKSHDVNKYLQSIMKGLTAKVFRTYNASGLFQQELNKLDGKFDRYNESQRINLLLDEFNKANAKVAMLCNHQKNINKNTSAQIKKLDVQIRDMINKIKTAESNDKIKEEQIKKLKDRLSILKSKRSLKKELKNISLGTSKINYIDPRITLAFLKRHKLPVNKLFSANLQRKFHWAANVDEHFKF